MCFHFLHQIKTKTLDYYFVVGEKVQDLCLVLLLILCLLFSVVIVTPTFGVTCDVACVPNVADAFDYV